MIEVQLVGEPPLLHDIVFHFTWAFKPSEPHIVVWMQVRCDDAFFLGY